MYTELESRTLCPRSGVVCPFLFELETQTEESVSMKTQAQTRYVDVVMKQAELSGVLELTHELPSSLNTADVSATWETLKKHEKYEESLVNMVNAYQRVIDHNNVGLRYARASCFSGPRIRRKRIITGKSQLRCSSLFSRCLDLFDQNNDAETLPD